MQLKKLPKLFGFILYGWTFIQVDKLSSAGVSFEFLFNTHIATQTIILFTYCTGQPI